MLVCLVTLFEQIPSCQLLHLKKKLNYHTHITQVWLPMTASHKSKYLKFFTIPKRERCREILSIKFFRTHRHFGGHRHLQLTDVGQYAYTFFWIFVVWRLIFFEQKQLSLIHLFSWHDSMSKLMNIRPTLDKLNSSWSWRVDRKNFEIKCCWLNWTGVEKRIYVECLNVFISIVIFRIPEYYFSLFLLFEIFTLFRVCARQHFIFSLYDV